MNTLEKKHVFYLGIFYCVFLTGVRTLVWEGAKAGVYYLWMRIVVELWCGGILGGLGEGG